MFRGMLLLLTVALVAAAAVNKTPLDLMIEGRFTEAEELLTGNDAPARYTMLLAALRETNAAHAAQLYRTISERYPGTDCDSLAQERLLMALEMGVSLEGAEPDVSTDPVEDMAAGEMNSNVDKSDRTPEQLAQLEPDQQAEPVIEEPMDEPVKDSPALESPTPEPAIESEQPAAKTPAATTGVTLNYSDAGDKSEEVQHAAAAAEQLMTKQAEELPVARPVVSDETAIDVPSESKTTEAIEAEVVEPEIERVPLLTKKTKEAEATGESDLALLESAKSPGITPQPPSNIPHDLDHTASEGDWYIQVGAFGNHDNAYALAAKLRSAGYPVVLVPRETESTVLMQVRVGGYATRDDGKRASAELKKDFNVPAVLVTK